MNYFIMWGYFKDNPKEELQNGLNHLQQKYGVIPITIAVNDIYKNKFECDIKTIFRKDLLQKVIYFGIKDEDLIHVKTVRMVK